MPTARLFIAAPVSDEVRAAAARLISRLRASGADYKWVDPANLHLTLRFLGATSLDRLGELETLLRRAARRPAFEVVYEGVGAFPSWDDPKVVWVGVGQGAADLAALAAALGPAEEGRPFSAHLTIGRMRGRRDVARLKAAAGGFAPLRQVVDRIILFESRLTPQGSIYAARQEAMLATRGVSTHLKMLPKPS